MAEIARRARGFLYTVSVTGTTGERASVDRSLASVLERAKRDCPVPVAVGFGISTPEQAAEAVAAGAEGVIVGSWLVRAAAEAADAGATPPRRSASGSRRWQRPCAARLRAAWASCSPSSPASSSGSSSGRSGAKGFDAFMITVLMLVLAAAGYMLAPHLPGRRRQD